MQVSSFQLEEILPHRPPMVLLDEVVSFDESDGSLVVAATIRPEWSENYVAIELMAQASAALAGIHDRIAGGNDPARPGFLLGTRRLVLDIDRFEVGRRYLVTSKNVFRDGEAASFECTVRDGDKTVASAVLNAYRPHDISSFLSSDIPPND